MWFAEIWFYATDLDSALTASYQTSTLDKLDRFTKIYSALQAKYRYCVCVCVCVRLCVCARVRACVHVYICMQYYKT